MANPVDDRPNSGPVLDLDVTSRSQIEHTPQLASAQSKSSRASPVPSKDAESVRSEFKSQFEYLVAVIGMAVGLGNIWRFPSVAYENGGGAFLIPYLCMGLLFGLPMLFLDSSLGQFMQNSAVVVFNQVMPASQGLGFSMAIVMISVAFFYNVCISWAGIYIIELIALRMDKMTSCTNDWNTLYCDSTTTCEEGLVYFNNTCYPRENRTEILESLNKTILDMNPATAEFFNNHVLNKHQSFEFGEFNWMMATSLFVCWAMTAGGLLKGVQSMGKVSLVTTTLPYILITVLFFRGVTLEGASVGIDYFLLKPDYSKVLELATWRSALAQMCFSLSIGAGSMIVLSSYNNREHKALRDCGIIIIADTFMSVFGGTAVFAILGSLSVSMGKDIKDLVSSPLTLSFIAYPEATSHMPISTLWALLFFFMMFLLGISTMFALVEGFCSSLCDQIPFFERHRTVTVLVTCVVSYLLSIMCFCFQVPSKKRYWVPRIMTAENGFHFFNVFNEFLGSFALSFCLFMEIFLIIGFYGPRRLFRDIESMFGPPTTLFKRLFGSTGLYLKIGITITAPTLAIVMCVVIMKGVVQIKLMDGNFEYPKWAVVLGAILGSAPLMAVPINLVANIVKFNKEKKPLRSLFTVQPEHPAIRYKLPPPPPLKEYFFPPVLKVTEAPAESSRRTEEVVA